jgi:hypothetical protein
MNNICEHDYLRRKCPFCEIAQLERENEQLRAELDHLKRGEWISVKERLPAVGETVLIYYRYHDQQSIVTARFVNGGFIGFWDADVTHWQPLPEPPKEGNAI